MIGRTEYQGEGFVIVCLPDGTRIHVPEWMTQPESANPPLHWPQRLSLASLTALRIAVDCVLSLQPGVTTHHEESMRARVLSMQADLFNAIACQSLPAVSRAEAVQLLARLLYQVQQAQSRQPANAEAGHEQDQR